MALVRVIGRAAMSGLVINYIVGSSIFGLPSELSRLLGHASPLAMIVGAMAMVIIMACAVEVGSQFSESGGSTFMCVGRSVRSPGSRSHGSGCSQWPAAWRPAPICSSRISAASCQGWPRAGGEG